MTLRSHFTLKYVFIVDLTRFFVLASEHHYVKKNEDTPILSATKIFARDSSFWYKAYSDMYYGFRAVMRRLTVGAIL